MMIHDIPKSWHIRHRLVYIRMHDMPLQQLNMIIHVHLLTLMDHPFPNLRLGFLIAVFVLLRERRTILA